MVSAKPYKGSRDFYPQDTRIRDWYFGRLAEVCESFGFERVDAPLIEPIELYMAKTSEEIVNQQIYSFEDRSGRKVAIRPEMTPSVSRMIASKLRELPKPIRWYSFPNLWRYERPGKGRLREHWQLNADIFASQDLFIADYEILQLALNILTSFGATREDFILKVNHRGILTYFLEHILKIEKNQQLTVARIIDKREKITESDFKKMLAENGVSASDILMLENYLEINTEQFLKEKIIPEGLMNCQGFYHLKELFQILDELGYSECIEYSPSVVRGFDYYTGMIFEVFDRDVQNSRSLFGGGRYDDLIFQFGKDSCNAVGFGMGDVTFQNFLENHALLKKPGRKPQIYLTLFENKANLEKTFKMAQTLRLKGFKVEMSLGTARLKKQLEEANQKQIPFVIFQGEEESRDRMVAVRNMQTGNQEKVQEEFLVSYLKSLLQT